MLKVKWTVECWTTVSTDDPDVAYEQVRNLFNNKEWGQTDGCELCSITIETMKIEEMES
jgi:hypothetical protein